MKKMHCLVYEVGLKLLSIIFFTFFTTTIFAQTITGTVKDEYGVKLYNVSVAVKGTSAGTVSNDEGKFSISAPIGSILQFSYVGFKPLEVTVTNYQPLDLVMQVSGENLGLSEVVVTALGIKKESRKLGYSATTVSPDQLTVNRTANPINALQGKVAGLNISSLGTGPGSTSKIRIRGQSSINGQNGPLIVINGVPVDNTNFNENTNGVKGGGVTADGGDGLSSINPDDIESMTVLKGGPAAALYGSRAKDGVIMITTKTKGKAKGIGVSYNVNYMNETPLDFTKYQDQYGQGENGVRPTAPNPTSGQWSFGEKIQPGMNHILFNNLTVPYVAQGSRIKEFYRHAQNLTHTVTLSNTTDKGGIYLSLTSSDNKGIISNNSFKRKGMNLGFTQNLSDKLTLAGNVNYTREVNSNPPNIANQDNSIPTTLMSMATTMPLSVLDANKYDPNTGNEYLYSRFTNRTNPYWILAEQFHNIKRDRIFGNVSVTYKLLPWLSAMGRFGQDYWSRDEDVNNFPTGQASRAAAPSGFYNGIYTQESYRFRESNLDFLLTANKTFNDLGLTVTAGGNQMRKSRNINNVQVTDFVIRDLYTVQNGRAKDPTYTLIEQGVNSLYGSVDLSWKNLFYLTGTARNDWFSTLSPANRSILYPSVSAAYVFSESLKQLSWLSFGKLRVGYAEVGSDGDVAPYSNLLFYAVNANTITNPNGQQVSVGGPVVTTGTATTLPNGDLKPSRVSEIEIGLDLRMFRNRVGLDLAVYSKTTRDQIVPVQISDASGFVNTRINSGESRNRGIEALLNIGIIKTNQFNWEFTANTGYNKTKVLSIITDKPGERITVGTHVFNGETRLVVGEEMGQIAGFGYQRDPKNGNQMIYQSNGLPLRTSEFVLFGSALPKWTGGFLNTFNYKGLSLSVFIDYKLGGNVLSGTNFNAVRHGLHERTLEGREGGVIGQGVNQAGAPNAVSVPVQTYWEHLRSQQIIESVIYNAGYWKLRQLTLGYDLTRFIPAKWPVKGLKIDLVANNVLMIKKWIDNIDPESFGFGSDNQVGLESPGLPTTRGIGVNVNIKF
ncbi:SusC/RagA family TonB-linked outer membrane protein [Terrimonas sp. NA20]|uniref:SusC/RagA family TonB-linked outer membrane protein n=1 Tax=Terrimonas ginsenosidimutans TaxID=2908004 RepID=A0ABS9KSB4_9BACT|nr:SusC/RagA family TonB-linked outer membrane protein [Terrimonas ginsenosidimutans]MCG2615216.1 SusC/RagA family TonB-linked outer membrane protein [Terrimonas ginsenosidimutans]